MNHKLYGSSAFGRTLLAALCATTMLTACSESDEAAFCNASKEFNLLVADINVSDIASSLGPDFWNSLSTSVGELKNSSPESLRSEIENLNSDLNSFIEQLESNDYNLLLMILDPETLASFTQLVEGVISKISTELSSFQSANC
jgi:hypothetical protein